MIPVLIQSLLLATSGLLPVVGQPAGQPENSPLRISGGRLFVDLTTLLRHRRLRRVAFGATSQFDALAPETLQLAMQRPEFRGPHGVHIPFAMFKGGVGILSQVWYALWRQDLTGFIPKTNRLIDQFIAEAKLRLNDALNDAPPGKAQLQTALDLLPTVFPFFLNWVPQFVAGEIAKRLITRVGRKWLDPAELEAVTLGLPGNVVAEMNLTIGDLADLARRSPPLRDWFNHLGDNSSAWLEQASGLADSAPFMAAWQDFLARYGARGSAEIDIMMPRWREEPMPVLHVIEGRLQQEAGVHRVQQQALDQAREAAARKLLQKAGGGLRGRLLKRLLYVMMEVGGLREHHKFVAVRILGVVKEILKQNARLLTTNGKLASPDDIWFLTWEELLRIWEENGGGVTAVIPQRRTNLTQYQKLTPPLVITSDGEMPVVQYHVDDTPPGALLGNPVSPGVVEGVVRVVHDPQTETLNPGEILVAPFTDPGWTPLFINAAGLIMEVGGSLTHGSVVAREYGIPAVVGVREATKTLHTGQRVRIDGNRGVIEVLYAQ